MKRTTRNQASKSDQLLTDKVSDTASVVREQIEDLGVEAIDQAKRKAEIVYDQANKAVNEQYQRAMGYGRENPGKTTLIALGVGFGAGLLVAGGFNTPRSRRGRVAEPLINALSNLARELLS